LNKLTKRSGELEAFSEAKLRASLTKAGATEENAGRVCETIARNSREGMATADVKKVAASELARFDGAAAQRYQAFVKR
jgi:hypothetical protein